MRSCMKYLSIEEDKKPGLKGGQRNYRTGDRAPQGSVEAAMSVNTRFRDGVEGWCGFFALLMALSCGRVGREEC